MKKQILAVIMTVVLSISMFPSFVYAEEILTDGDITTEGTEGVISEDSVKLDSESNFEEEDLETENEEAPTGYSLEETNNQNTVSLASVDESGTNGDLSWSIEDGVLTISGEGEMSDFTTSSYADWYQYRSSITSVIIESGVTSIGQMAFYNCSYLTEVSLPSTIESIGEYAFTECTSLAKIDIPTSVTELPYAAFAGCKSLETIALNNVETIGDYVFQEVPIANMYIPASVTSISALAFFNASIVDFSAEENGTYTAIDGVLYSDNGETLFAYPQANSATSFEVPSGVTKIGRLAFAYSENIVDVSFPSSVNSFDESAFQYAEAITSFSIPDSVTEVGYFIFYNCPNLEEVTFGRGLTSTNYQMFRDCDSLTTIDFGDTLTTLYSQTFAYCDALVSVTLPENITSIGVGCFGCCYNLTTFVSKGLTDVISFQSFYACTSLTSVTLNEGVTYIARCAFYYCSSLASITLPESMEYVHFNAFPSTTVITNKNTALRQFGSNGYTYIEDVSISGEYYYDMAYEVLELVNEERVAEGLSELVMNESLLETAMTRGSETAVLFSHTRPDGSSCFYSNSLMAAENIAAGQTSASAVMESWMNSSGHKANILSEDYTTIGIGCFYHNGIYYWVQCFGTGSDTESCTQPSDASVTKTVSKSVDTFSEATLSTGTIWGGLESYTYEYSISFNTSIKSGETTTAEVCVKNPGFTSCYALLNSTCLTFSSSDSDIAKVDDSGLITAVATGSAYITASLEYSSVSEEIKINYTEDDGTDNDSNIDNNDNSSTKTTNKTISTDNNTNTNTSSANVGETYTVGNFTHRVTKVSTGTDGTVTLISSVNSKKKVTIPDTVTIDGKTYKVTAINKNAFKGDTKLKTLIVGTNVKKIGASAFEGCTNLKKVTIGSNVTSIGNKAFKNCKKLTKVTIPAKVKKIGKSAFMNCTSLKTLVIGKNVKKIGAKAFYNCKSLTKITIKSKKLKTSSVGKKAFSKVSEKVTIKVPKAKLKAYKKLLYARGISKKTAIL